MSRQILLLLDPQTGHRNQVEGMARALAALAETAVQRLDIAPRRFARSSVRRALLRLWRGDASSLFGALYGHSLAAITPPEVILASGSKTLAAGILLARHFGARLVVSGWLFDYDPADVQRWLVPSPRYAGEPQAVFAPAPGLVAARHLPKPQPVAADLRDATAGLLIGGPSHGHSYGAEDWRRLVALVEAGARAGLRWRITTSRRSPPELAARLAELRQRGAVEHLVDARAGGAGDTGDVFSSDLLVVTEDSVSMISEAMAAGRPVIVLRPERVADSWANEMVAAFAALGALAVLPLRTATPEQFARAIEALRPLDIEGWIVDALREV